MAESVCPVRNFTATGDKWRWMCASLSAQELAGTVKSVTFVGPESVSRPLRVSSSYRRIKT